MTATPPRSPSIIRVVVGEDNAIFARGIEQILGEASDIRVVGMATDRDGLLALVAREQADVVLTDIRMPPTLTDEGLQVARKLLASRSQVGVVMLSQYVDTAVALELFAGSTKRRGYLLKDRVGRPATLLQAVRDVADGGTVVDPEVVEVLISARGTGAGSALADLTSREMDVLRLVAQGLANQGIADRLSIGRPAVEKNLTSVFNKLGIADDAQTVNRRVSAALVYLANNQGAAAEGNPALR
jgi:DNA-binding NarL/FixJ family response regulator